MSAIPISESKVVDIVLVKPDDPTSLTPKIDYVADKLTEMFNGRLTTTNILTAVTKGMSLMTDFISLSGVTKKSILLTALEQVVKSSKLLSGDEKDKITLFVDTFASSAIDALFDLASKKIDFTKLSRKWCGCITGGDPA